MDNFQGLRLLGALVQCIMVIIIMRVTHLRQSDLNLLVAFVTLAEERTITGAASRLFLSQPAMSRALQRLRGMFKDDLFIRGAGGYQLTPKGKTVLRELEVTLPKLDRLLGGDL